MRFCAVLLGGLCLLAPTVAPAEILVDRIAFTVDGEVVTLSQVEARAIERRGMDEDTTDAVRAGMLRDAATQLVDEALLENELKRRGIQVSESEVKFAMDQVRSQQQLSEEDFKRAVELQGYDWPTYQSELKVQLRRAKLLNAEVRSKVQISDADIQAELKRTGQWIEAGGFEVRVRHILLKIPKDATPGDVDEVRARIDAARARVVERGDAFADVAKAVSEDATAEDGGDLGWFGKGLMVPEFEAVAFSVEPGVVSQPVRTTFGWHILKIEARREAKTTVSPALRSRTQQRLYQAEVEIQTLRFLDRLRKRAVVDFRLPGLTPAAAGGEGGAG